MMKVITQTVAILLIAGLYFTATPASADIGHTGHIAPKVVLAGFGHHGFGHRSFGHHGFRSRGFHGRNRGFSRNGRGFRNRGFRGRNGGFRGNRRSFRR